MSAKRSFHHSFLGTCSVEGVEPLQDQEQLKKRSTGSGLLDQDDKDWAQ